MCDGCLKKNVVTTGAVINGRFGQFCRDCRTKLQRFTNPASAQYARDRDREEHLQDLIQPWDGRGYPNPEFIRMYPEEAKLNFTQEEIEKFGR